MKGRYSDVIHKSQLLSHDRESPWLTPMQIQEKENLNGILNRIMFSIKMLNFILSQRDIHVNTYRKKMSDDQKLDDTNVTQHIRRCHIILAQKYDCTINAIFFQNIQKAYEQNKNRNKSLDKKILDKSHKDLEPPHKSEGYGFIQIIH